MLSSTSSPPDDGPPAQLEPMRSPSMPTEQPEAMRSIPQQTVALAATGGVRIDHQQFRADLDSAVDQSV